MNPQIQPYTLSDKPLLLAIFSSNVPKYFAPHEEDLFAAYLEREGETFYTLRLGDDIVGGVGYKIEDSKQVGKIVWIFIHPDHHRKGLGNFAVDWCLKRIHEQGTCEKLIVWTSQWGNDFFEQFGFRTVRFKKDHWGSGLHLYAMELYAM